MADTFDNGLREGRWTSWHVNGFKQEEGEYLAGNRRGSWTIWSDTGQVASIEPSEVELIEPATEPELVELPIPFTPASHGAVTDDRPLP